MRLKIIKRGMGKEGYEAKIISKIPKDCISAFGKTPLEAEVNVFAIRNAIKREELKTNVIIRVET